MWTFIRKKVSEKKSRSNVNKTSHDFSKWRPTQHAETNSWMKTTTGPITMYFNGMRCPAYAIDLNSENMDFCKVEIQCWAHERVFIKFSWLIIILSLREKSHDFSKWRPTRHSTKLDKLMIWTWRVSTTKTLKLMIKPRLYMRLGTKYCIHNVISVSFVKLWFKTVKIDV
jgi:hypothetical protein